MFWIRIEDFQAICFNVGVELFTYKQPIPPFTTRFPGILESCLNSPLQQTRDGDLYPEFEDKLSFLFYLMIKNHPFMNGNKRMAVAALLAILYGNDKWIMASSDELYNLAVDVSNSTSGEKDKYILKIKSFLKKHLVERSVFEKWIEKIIHRS